jgi:hypothetical protein
MVKKSQVTLFIITGIIIIVLVAIIYQLQNIKSNSKNQPQNLDNTIAIKNYVENCMGMNLEQGVEIIGTQGGYFHPKYYELESPHYVSYLFYDNINYVPTIEELEEQLSLYIDNKIVTCANFSRFIGIKFEVDDPKTSTKIINGSISSTLNWKLTLEKEDEVQTLEIFNVEMNSNLYQIHSVVNELMLNSEIGFDELDMSILDVQNLEHNITKFFPNKIRYNLVDYTDDKNPYEFTFYEQLDISEELNANKAPKFTKIDDLNISVGEIFQYKFEAKDPENDPLIFNAKTVLFELLDNGELYFIAQEHLIGEYVVPVYVYDNHDNLDFSIIKVNIQ